MQGIDNLKGGGATTLKKLGDVAISSPDDGQVLKYDSPTHMWKNTSSLEYTIPSYYESEFASTKLSVEQQETNASFNVLVMTDLHFGAKGEDYHPDQIRTPLFNTIAAAKKFIAEVPIEQVVMGGDYMQFDPEDMTKEMGVSNIAELNEYWDDVSSPFFAIEGNHEEHYTGGSGIGLSANEVYRLLTKKWVSKNNIKQVSTNTFYRIDDFYGVCHVFVSTALAADTEDVIDRDWTAITAANTNHYPYIIYNHFGSTDANEDDVDDNIKNSIDIIKTAGGTIIAWISGHRHFDWVHVYDNTLVITLSNSSYWSNNVGQDGVAYTKTVRTATESAFSVLTIVPSTGKLFVTRFGAGVDFECNYNSISGSVGRIGYIPSYNYTVTQELTDGVTCTNSSPTTAGGEAYTNTLIVPDSNFTIDTVVVTMDRVDITATAYNSSTHVVSISDVTGNIVITASATNTYPLTIAECDIKQHNETHVATWTTSGNNITITTDVGNSGIRAKMPIKYPINSDTYFTLKADSVNLGENSGIVIKLKYFSSTSATILNVDYLDGGDLGDLITGITKLTPVADITGATQIGLEVRTKSSGATLPLEASFTNLRLEYTI